RQGRGGDRPEKRQKDKDQNQILVSHVVARPPFYVAFSPASLPPYIPDSSPECRKRGTLPASHWQSGELLAQYRPDRLFSTAFSRLFPRFGQHFCVLVRKRRNRGLTVAEPARAGRPGALRPPDPQKVFFRSARGWGRGLRKPGHRLSLRVEWQGRA